MEKAILVVDAAHIFFPAFVSEREGTPHERAMADIDRVVESARSRYDVALPIVMAVDRPPYKRSDVYSGYKAKRKAHPEGYDDAYTAWLAEFALSSAFRVLGEDGYEADDICAAVAFTDQSEWEESPTIVIATRDKDLFQLVNDERPNRVRVLSTASLELFGEEEVYLKMGVWPDQVAKFLALAGDSADGVPGVEGIGKVGATKLLKRESDLGDIETRLNVEQKSQFLLSLSLVELTVMDLQPVIPAIDYSWEARRNFAAPPKEAPVVAEPLTYEKKRELANIVSESLSGVFPIIDYSSRVPKVPKAPDAQVAPAVRTTKRDLSMDTLNTLTALSKKFWASGFYSRFKSEDGIFTIMVTGMELGIAPVAALGNFHVLDGKLCPSAHVLIALAQAASDCIMFDCVAESETSATYRVKKSNGFTADFTYTVADAKRDQMRWANGGKNLKAMIRKTAGSQAARLWFPGELNGLYSAEEMGESVSED